ncbi:MAG: hypothetical protein AAB611_02235 [Patescibacteria group bacterium]
MDQQQSNPIPTAPMAPQLSSSVDNRRTLAIISYLSLLVIVPLIIAKDDVFVKFHAKQGLVLVIFEMIPWAFSILLTQFYFIMPFSLYLSIVGILGFVNTGLYIVVIAFIIVGIMNARNGKQNELPLIGGFAKIFTF